MIDADITTMRIIESGKTGMDTIEQGNDKAAGRWCILRTAGARTLPLADSLTAAGYDVWTPRRTFKRDAPGQRRLPSNLRRRIEADAPILPTFVFAPADRLVDLAVLAVDEMRRVPAFSVFRHAGRVPLVGNSSIMGLRAEEEAAALLTEAERSAERREEARRARAAAMRTERERRKALRAEYRDFAIGQAVNVGGAPALRGISGVVTKSNGRSAIVEFGGSLIMEIEAWRLYPVGVYGEQPYTGTAA